MNKKNVLQRKTTLKGNANGELEIDMLRILENYHLVILINVN